MKTKLFPFVIVAASAIIAVFVIRKNNSEDKINTSYAGSLDITVYRSATCRCCGNWINHLKKNNFNVTDIQSHDMASVKQKYNLPKAMESCHTAIIDGYIIEGHVPADDIKLLLKTRPAVAGLSVPEMPVGTPGMEMDNRKDPFKVISFDRNGKFETFNEYSNY